jgi:protein TonB
VQIDNPRWSQRPTNLERYYPRRALQREIEGAAVLDCLVSTAGELTCSVISETPRGWDFGAAALRMAADHRMVPATRAGVPVEGRYRMRVPFNLD